MPNYPPEWEYEPAPENWSPKSSYPPEWEYEPPPENWSPESGKSTSSKPSKSTGSKAPKGTPKKSGEQAKQKSLTQRIEAALKQIQQKGQQAYTQAKQYVQAHPYASIAGGALAAGLGALALKKLLSKRKKKKK